MMSHNLWVHRPSAAWNSYHLPRFQVSTMPYPLMDRGGSDRSVAGVDIAGLLVLLFYGSWGHRRSSHRTATGLNFPAMAIHAIRYRIRCHEKAILILKNELKEMRSWGLQNLLVQMFRHLCCWCRDRSFEKEKDCTSAHEEGSNKVAKNRRRDCF